MQAIFALMSLILLSPAATAGTDQVEAKGQFWLNAGGVSYHFDRNKSFNEKNAGLGLEYRINENASVAVGQYKNSVWSDTRYASLAWTPLHYGIARVGVLTGLADGYPNMRHGDVFPLITPFIAIEGRRVGVNLMVIPSIASRKVTIDGAVVLQFKIRFGGT